MLIPLTKLLKNNSYYTQVFITILETFNFNNWFHNNNDLIKLHKHKIEDIYHKIILIKNLKLLQIIFHYYVLNVKKEML